MGVVIKQSFWSTIIAYIGVMVGYVNTLYLRPEFFVMGEIGLFGLITANAMMISPFTTLGMNSSYIKFFPSYKEKERNAVFTFQFLIVTIGCILAILIGYSLKDLIRERYAETAPEYLNYLSITAIIIVVNSFFDMFFSYSRTVMKVLFPSFLRDIFLRLGAIFLVTGYALEWFNFEWAVKGLGINYSLAFLLLFGKVLLFDGYRFDFNFFILTKEWKKRLFLFSGYSMLAAGSFAVMNNVTYDQVTAILGTEANGIFITCFFIGTIVEMPRRNMAKVISPVFSAELQNNNMKEVETLYKRSSITMSVIGLLIFVGIITNMNDLFSFIPKGAAFSTGFWVVTMVCAAKLVIMISSFPAEIINYSPLYRYNLFFIMGASGLLVIANIFLLPIWGLNGAGISYFSVVVIHTLVKIFFVKKHFGCHPFGWTHTPLLIITTVVGVMAWVWQPDFHPVINILIRSIVTTLLFCFLVYRFRISEDINKLIRSTFERFLNIKLSK